MMKNGIYQLKKLLPLMAMGVLALAVGCSDDDDTTQPPSEFAPPSNLTFSNNEQFDRIDLSWTASPDAGIDDFAGYEIYQSTTSLAGLTGAEADSFKVAGGPFDTTSRSISVPAGVRYYFNVRAVKDNGDLSEATTQVETALPESGEEGIVEFADKSGDSGMDLSEGTTYSVMIENLEHIDFFLGTTDGGNDPGSELALKSPSLLEGENEEEWANRIAAFKLIDDPDASSTTSAGFIDSITLTAAEVEGKAIVVRLPQDENGELHYGKISRMEFDGEPGNRTMLFSWTYQPVPNYLRF